MHSPRCCPHYPCCCCCAAVGTGTGASIGATTARTLTAAPAVTVPTAPATASAAAGAGAGGAAVVATAAHTPLLHLPALVHTPLRPFIPPPCTCSYSPAPIHTLCSSIPSLCSHPFGARLYPLVLVYTLLDSFVPSWAWLCPLLDTTIPIK